MSLKCLTRGTCHYAICRMSNLRNTHVALSILGVKGHDYSHYTIVHDIYLPRTDSLLGEYFHFYDIVGPIHDVKATVDLFDIYIRCDGVFLC